MAAPLNALCWDGNPGHYEVYYLTLTDPASGVGVWIRYTLLAPLESTGQNPECALWFLAMDPRPGGWGVRGGKQSLPIEALDHRCEPFMLRLGEAVLSDEEARGGFGDCAWELRWRPAIRSHEHVRASLRRAGVAQTVLVLPHGDVSISGVISLGVERLELERAPGAQAHLWGSKHARRWAWAHCNDFRRPGGERVSDAMVDGVSVFVSRFGREMGPNTPVVGHVEGSEFASTAPLRVLANRSEFSVSGWRFEAVDGARKLLGEVRAPRGLLAGVTYHDPDGEPAYCYNTEAASMEVRVLHRLRGRSWSERERLLADGCAHFEYAQRTRLAGVELLV